MAGFGELFALLVVISLSATLVSAPLLWNSLRDVELVRDGDGVFSGVEGLSTGQSVQLGFVLVVIVISNVLIFGGATSHLESRRSEHPSSWRESLRMAVQRSPRLIGVTLAFLALTALANMVGILIGAAVPALGLLFSPFLFLFYIQMWVRGGLALTWSSLGRPGGSIRNSVRLTRGLTWALLGRFILLATLVVAMQLLGAIFSAPLQWTSGAQPIDSAGNIRIADVIGTNAASFYGGQVVTGLITGITVAIWASAMLAIFHRVESE